MGGERKKVMSFSSAAGGPSTRAYDSSAVTVSPSSWPVISTSLSRTSAKRCARKPGKWVACASEGRSRMLLPTSCAALKASLLACSLKRTNRSPAPVLAAAAADADVGGSSILARRSNSTWNPSASVEYPILAR